MLRHCVSTFLKTSPPRVLYSTHKLENPTPLVLKLMSEFDNISAITHALNNNQELNNIHFDDWKNRIHVLKRHHFSDKECFKMISTYPYILKIPLKNFENSVKQWFMTQIGLENFQFLLLNQPLLIDIDCKEIVKRIPYLLVYLRSPQHLCKVLADSPNLMSDDWDAVLEKLNFLFKENRFNIDDIIQSQAFSKSLNFIKFRLDLLKKCGIYRKDNTPIHKLNKYDKTKYRNPSLKDIISQKGNDFLKVAKISPEEYIVCRDLFFEQDDEEEEEEDFKSSYIK